MTQLEKSPLLHRDNLSKQESSIIKTVECETGSLKVSLYINLKLCIKGTTN